MWKSKRPSNITIKNNFMFDTEEKTKVTGFVFNPQVRNLKVEESEKAYDKDFFFFSKNSDLETDCKTPEKSLQDAPKNISKIKFFP